MSAIGADADLIVLVADKDIEFAVKGLLTRGESLSIRDVAADVYPHPQRDPACARRAHDFLRSFCKQYRHALVLFDLEGSGNAGRTREEIEAEVEAWLSKTGWQDRSAVVVLDPELEAWVWSDSPHVADVLGWSSPQFDLRDWLRAERFLTHADQAKPARPKEAMEAALRRVGTRRSSSIYYDLARLVSLKKCGDPAFLKLKSKLQDWFPRQ